MVGAAFTGRGRSRGGLGGGVSGGGECAGGAANGPGDGDGGTGTDDDGCEFLDCDRVALGDYDGGDDVFVSRADVGGCDDDCQHVAEHVGRSNDDDGAPVSVVVNGPGEHHARRYGVRFGLADRLAVVREQRARQRLAECFEGGLDKLAAAVFADAPDCGCACGLSVLGTAGGARGAGVCGPGARGGLVPPRPGVR